MSTNSIKRPPRPRRGDPYLQRLIAPVYAPTAIYSTGTGAIQPVLVLAALAIGMSHSAASSVVGVMGTVGMFAAPIAGLIVTRLGGRRSMISAVLLAVASLSLILVMLKVSISTAAFWFTIGVVFLSTAGSIWALARQGSVADSVPPSLRARALAMLGGMMRLGVLAGPAVGSALVAAAGVSAPFVLAIFTSLLALSLVILFPMPTSPVLAQTTTSHPESPADNKLSASHPSSFTPRDHADVRATAITAFAITTLTLERANRIVLVPLWGDHLGMSDALISATFAAGALVDVAMFLPAGRWMDRYGRLMGFLPSLVIISLGLAMTVTWTSPVGFIVGTCLMGLGNGFSSGIIMTSGVDLAPEVGRDKFLGLWNGIAAIGQAAGPFVVAFLTATVGLDASMWFTVAVGLIGAAWAALMLRPAYARVGIDLRGRALK